MNDKKIKRINELSKKSKTSEGLTQDEKDEQIRLRKEYVASMKQSLVSQLDNTYYIDKNGHKQKVERKKDGKTDNN